MLRQRTLFVGLSLALFFGQGQSGSAQDSSAESDETVKITLAGGKLALQAPKAWKNVEPKSSMLEVEFAIEKMDDDERDGRLTIMAAGGSIQANIDRWVGQFSQPDGSDSADKAKVESGKIDGLSVHMVDITGTYSDSPGGPRAPAVQRKDYRMLAAIIETGGSGTYFIKFYGPKNTVEKNAKRFRAFLKSLSAD